MERHKTVDAFMAATKQWKPELVELRAILKSTELNETLKWGAPVYTFQGKNIVGLGGFKSYFGSAAEIDRRAIERYVKEAIGLVMQGVEIKPERKKAVAIPEELQAAFRKQRKARASFDKLTPGKQREYLDYVAQAKQDATRLRRVEKILPMIESGVGLNDTYRNC